MQIHPVNHSKGDTNRWCGPSAISIVTSMTTGEAARLLRHVTGKASIKGTENGAMINAFRKCGVGMIRIQNYSVKVVKVPTLVSGQMVAAVKTKGVGKRIDERPTLAAWFKQTADLRSTGRVFLISAGHHWQIVSGRRFCCGLTKEIVGFDHKKVHRRARVNEVFELFGDRIVIPPEAKKTPGRAAQGGRARFNELCRQNLLSPEIDGMPTNPEYIDFPSSEMWPNGLSFCFWDWDDAIRIVEIAIDDPSMVGEEGWYSH